MSCVLKICDYFCGTQQNNLLMIYDILLYCPMLISINWAAIFLFSRSNNKELRVLGMFMLAVFFVFLSHSVYYHNVYEHFVFFDLLFAFCSLIVFPLYYCYIRLLTIDKSFVKRYFLYFLPAASILIINVMIYSVMTKAERGVYFSEYLFSFHAIKDSTGLFLFKRVVAITSKVIYVLQILFVCSKVVQLTSQHNEEIEGFYSYTEFRFLKWHKQIRYTFILISALSLYTAVLGRIFFHSYHLAFVFVATAYSLLLFYLAYLGYSQNKNSVEDVLSKEAPTTDRDIFNELKIELVPLFEQKKMYLRSDLKITDIATMLHTNRTYISRFINTEYGCTFSFYVNKYRITAAKELLLLENLSQYSLEYIAEKVGFSNLHTFIRVFKDIEGVTPGVYRKNHSFVLDVID